MARNRVGRRGGFTLIELLIVIAIIATLIGLLVPAVMRAIVLGPKITARGEMNGLAQAHAAFLSEFPGVKHIPSQIVLREDGAYNLGNALEKRSKLYLEAMFGSRLTYPVDWNGDGTPGNGTWTLHGEECLTFFLGGIPSGTSCLGFSTNPANPAAAGGTRRGPYYQFPPGRLVATNGAFFSYKDPFAKGRYYAYLSASKAGNDYATAPTDSSQGVQPYFMSAGVFMNRNSFQIITAGRDGVFGTNGNTWNSTTGYGMGQAGSDDMANFARSELAAPLE